MLTLEVRNKTLNQRYLFSECGGMLNGSSGSFSTPGYPSSYYDDLDCMWTIPIPVNGSLWLKFFEFETESR